MDIIVVQGKNGDTYYNASNKGPAFLSIFKDFDENNYYEADLTTAREKTLVKKAREGNALAAEELLNARRSYEYEEWHYAVLQEPF